MWSLLFFAYPFSETKNIHLVNSNLIKEPWSCISSLKISAGSCQKLFEKISKTFKNSNNNIIKLLFCRQGFEAADVVDSDFSIDEDDELVSDNGAEGKPERKRPANSRAYRVCLITKSLLISYYVRYQCSCESN